MRSVPQKKPTGLAEAIKIDPEQVKSHVDELVRGTVEQTLNSLLDAEADRICNARRYERSVDRQDKRSGHYKRKLATKAGEVELKVPKLRTLAFETAIIERYRRRESSVEEALVEMYLAGVSVRRVEDITEALWGSKVSPSTISALNGRIYTQIEAWRNRKIEGTHTYVYLDGIWLKRSWGGEVKNIAVLVAIGVDQEGFREVLGVAEGAKEDTQSWRNFLRHLKQRGLSGIKLFVSDKCIGVVEAIGECYPDAAWQRCVVHWMRNVFTVTPRGRWREVAAMLKAIHAQEDKPAARKKGQEVAAKLRKLKLARAAEVVESGLEETLPYYAFPSEHWRSLRTNNPLERVLKEVRRRTKVIGAFPDGQSALMLVAARLRHVASTRWGTRKYMDMQRLAQPAEIEELTAAA
jgi:transposase-like protein